MSEIDPYIGILLFQSHAALPLKEGYLRVEEHQKTLADVITVLLSKYNAVDLVDVQQSAQKIIARLVKSGVIGIDEPRFAGKYFVYSNSRYQKYRDTVLNQDGIATTAQRIGHRFFPDVFAGYRQETSVGKTELPTLGMAPAANRIVTFSDNQISDFDSQISKLVDEVSSHNQVADAVGVRELILGQLKAGRELIRAGSFRLYIFEVTLVNALKFLVTKYEKEVIGALASTLLTALSQHLGIGS